MFVMEYENGAWQRGKIEPYGPFTMSPASMVFHYGQAIFEGMKAYNTGDGGVSIFRPGKKHKSLQSFRTQKCACQKFQKIYSWKP